MKRITFTETPGSRPAAPISAPVTSDIPKSGDHRGWAAWWGGQAVAAMRRACEPGAVALDIQHAVRAARLAWWHISTAKGYRYWDDRWQAIRLEETAGKDEGKNISRDGSIFVDGGTELG